MVNNSSGQISLAQVYTALYDKDNKLISVESGSVDVSTLAVGDNSAFTMLLCQVEHVDDRVAFHNLVEKLK